MLDDNHVYLGYVDFEMPLRQTKAEVKSAVEYRDQVWAAALELEYIRVCIMEFKSLMEIRSPGSNGRRKRAVDLELSLDKLEHLEA